ncbi:MAG: hypothetical protein ACE5JX_08390 [Acidobacteriota bacterium]
MNLACFQLFDLKLVLAYLDPGSGSMLLQLLLGGVAGAFVLVKLFWRRITTFFTGEDFQTPAEEQGDDLPAPGEKPTS